MQSERVDALVSKNCSVGLDISSLREEVLKGHEARRNFNYGESDWVATVWSLVSLEGSDLRLKGNTRLYEDVQRCCCPVKRKDLADDLNVEVLGDAGD